MNLHFELLLTTLKLLSANILRPAVDHLLPQIAQDLDKSAMTGSNYLHEVGVLSWAFTVRESKIRSISFV